MQSNVGQICVSSSFTLLTQKKDSYVSVKFKDKELPEP